MGKHLYTSPEMKAYIKANYLKISSKEIGDNFNKTGCFIKRRMVRLGLVVPITLIRRWRADKLIRPFSKSEDDFILKNIGHLSIKNISKSIKRTSGYVSIRAKELGLGHIIAENAFNSLIKRGSVPKNKGLKQTQYMSADAIEKTKATRFKKGNQPHNTYGKPGMVTVRRGHVKRGGRPYKYICIEVGKWLPLHQHLWEKANGKVPAGYCLWFKDKDNMNCVLENIELITRKENRIRNAGWKMLTDAYLARCIVGKNGNPQLVIDQPELLKIKKMQLKLKRAIKSHDKN
jgi:hypothetical protein